MKNADCADSIKVKNRTGRYGSGSPDLPPGQMQGAPVPPP